MYDKSQYAKAIEQLEQTTDYKETGKYLDKCRMELKYEKFDYDSFTTLGDDSVATMTNKEIREYMEECMNAMYSSWYRHDQNNESVVIDKYFMDGKEYGIASWGGEGNFTEFDIYYMDDVENKIHISLSPDFVYMDVADEAPMMLSIGEMLYYNYSSDQAEEYAELNEAHQEAIEAQQPQHTKEVFKLIEGSKNSKIYLMLLFNVVMGLRCSEIIGIKYSDIDFINQKLTIRRQLGRDIKKDDSELDAKTLTKQEVRTKTPSSVRTIDIPDIVYEAILKQRKYYQACKSRRKTAFQDLRYVCCSSYGRPRSKNYHYEHFKQLLKELDLPDVRWHDLRGTCATLLLMQGISPKAIAKNLGHSTEIVTVDNYIDKSKLSVIKLDKLDSFIDSVVPKTNCEEEDKDFSKVIIDVSEFF